MRSSLADDEIISEEKNQVLKISKSNLLDSTDDESYFKSLSKLDEKLSDETESGQSQRLVDMESLSDERINKTGKTITITSKKPAKLIYTKTFKPTFSTSTKPLLTVRQTTALKATILTRLTTRLKTITPVTKAARQKKKPKSEVDQYLLQQDELKTCKENSRDPEVLGELTYKIFLRIKFPDVCQEPCYRECIIVKCKLLKCNKFTD